MQNNVLDKLFGEYRAFTVGFLGKTNMLTAANVQYILDILGRDKNKTPPGYMDFSNLYQNKKIPQFKSVIDQAYKDADKGKIVDGGEMRKRLIAVSLGTAYVVGTNNNDNH